MMRILTITNDRMPIMGKRSRNTAPRLTWTLIGLAGIFLGLLSAGCGGSRSLATREPSLDLPVSYEQGRQADAVRLSNPFWLDNETFGWLEIHHFTRKENKPHGNVGATLWLMTYNAETGNRTRELYLVSDREFRRPFDTVRFSEDVLVRLNPRHSSEVIRKELYYIISPGNDLNDSNETGRHFPYDYNFGLHASGQRIIDRFLNEKSGSLDVRVAGLEFRVFDIRSGELTNRTEVRDDRLLPTDGFEGRLLDPTTLFLCHPKMIYGSASEDGSTYYDFSFLKVSLASGELTSLGSFRIQANNFIGWDVSRDGNTVVIGNVHRGASGSIESLVLRRTEVTANKQAEWNLVHTIASKGFNPAISPDGARVVLYPKSIWHRPRYGIHYRSENPYFIDVNPLSKFTIYELPN
jgi:hypothetical protein